MEIAIRWNDEQWRADHRRTQQPTVEPHWKWSGSTPRCLWYWLSRLRQRTNPHQSSRGRALVVAIRGLRNRIGPGCAISIFHIDQPSNDFATLFAVLEADPDRYVLDEPNVFYENVLP